VADRALPRARSEARARGAARITADRGVAAARPVALFDVDADDLEAGLDVAPNGQSIFLRRRVAAPQHTTRARYVLVQNWIAEFSK
jgi:hypothetical protein